MLEIKTFELPPIGTNAYLVLDTETKLCFLFDAPMNVRYPIDNFIVKEGYTLSGLAYTHGHWDHMLDGFKFDTDKYPVFAHHADEMFFNNPATMAAFAMPGMEMNPAPVNHWLSGGEVLDVLGRQVEVRHVPGHSPGSVLFWFVDEAVAITGDVVFKQSIGRTDFPGCSFEQLEKSIKTHVFTLPDNTKLLPGHGPETNVSFEKTNNPFVSP